MTTPKLPSFKPALNRSEAEESRAFQPDPDAAEQSLHGHPLPPVQGQNDDDGGADSGDPDRVEGYPGLSGQSAAFVAAPATHPAAKHAAERPIFNAIGPEAFWQSDAAATFLPESRAEANRRDYGDYRPWSQDIAKMTYDIGRRIEFEDAPFNVMVAYDPEATTIDPEVHRQMLYWMDAARINEGNPMYHRLDTYLDGDD